MDGPRPTPLTHHRLLASCLLGVVAVLALSACSGDSVDPENFGELDAGTRIYDRTDRSLSDAEMADLEERLDSLDSETGADVVAVVRDLDADPEETLEQVEALQQAWVAATGVDQDIAGAILVNREPGTDDEARAGIFVGSTYDDGNVPGGEQEAIVEDELVPPLRDGDVAASLTAGIERLDTSIRNGPPTGPLDDFAEGAGSSWLPWAGLAVVLLGLGGTAWIYSGRARSTVPERSPTTTRPDRGTPPTVAAALVAGRAGPSAVPSVILDLAARDALAIEQEKEPGTLSAGTVQIRLLDRTMVRGDVERAVWAELDEQADHGLVDSTGLGKAAGKAATAATKLTRAHLQERGWLRDGMGRTVAALVALAGLGLVLMIGGIVVASAGALLMLVTVIPAGVLVLAALLASVTYSRLTVPGLDAARPWEAYRDGLKTAGKDETVTLDLDDALPDVIALNLGGTFEKRLEAATDAEAGTTLRAFTPPGGEVSVNPAIFPWGSFTGVFAATSGSGTVSGGGAGGGGGAAGGT